MRSSAGRALVGIAVFVGAMWAMGEAAVYGGRWESMARPTPDVTIVLNDQTVLKGAFHVEMNGTNVIEDADGHRYRFRPQDYQVMSRQVLRHQSDFSMLDHWRALLPMELVFLAYVAFVFRGSLGRSLARRAA